MFDLKKRRILFYLVLVAVFFPFTVFSADIADIKDTSTVEGSSKDNVMNSSSEKDSDDSIKVITDDILKLCPRIIYANRKLNQSGIPQKHFRECLERVRRGEKINTGKVCGRKNK